MNLRRMPMSIEYNRCTKYSMYIFVHKISNEIKSIEIRLFWFLLNAFKIYIRACASLTHRNAWASLILWCTPYYLLFEMSNKLLNA